MGFNLHLFIGINKFIFAGWCVLVSFSSWAENDQRAFDTIHRCICELLVHRGVGAVSFMKYSAHFSSPTVRTLHGDLMEKGFSQAMNFKCLVFCTENDLRL